MAQTINTNVQSLVAQRNLFRSSSSLSTSIERLSSGLRINSARDDAAGLAISERMSSQLRGMEVAKRNANDGISALQVADGSLASLGDNLQRMRELAVQASTGTLSASDRENLDLEFRQLSAEISRVAKGSEFNGVKLLDGSTSSFELQIGASSDSQLAINFANIDSDIESFRFSPVGTAVTDGADALAQTIGELGATSTGDLMAAQFGDKIDLNGDGSFDLQVADAGDYGGTAGQFQLLDANGDKVGMAQASADFSTVAIGSIGGKVVSGTNGGTEDVTVEVANADFRFNSSGTAFTSIDAELTLSGGDGKASQASLDKIDDLLDIVNEQRATLGAGINRLDAVINNLENSLVNLGAARGRIVDADFARETANLTRTQILQQAGTAMLAQANQLPANVLSLLG